MMKKILVPLMILPSLITQGQTNTFPSSGNVGIGTLSPVASVDVTNSTVTGDAKLFVQQTNANAEAGLGSAETQLKSSTGNTTLRFLSYNAGGAYIESGTYAFTANQPLNFTGYSGNQGSNLNVNFLTSYFTGNVGIGTATPGEKLSIARTLPYGYSSMLSLNELSNNGSNSMGIDFKFGGLSGFPWGSTGRIEVARQSTSSNFDMLFHTATSGVLSEKMRILNNGNVGIGTSAPQAKLDVNGNIYSNGKIFIGTPDGTTATKIAPYSLAVNGSAIFTKAVVKLNSAWPDYVFTPDYKMPTLDSLEFFINTNGHLPEIPTEEDVKKNGIDLGENQEMLLKKIEELTLLTIQMNKQSEELRKTLNDETKKNQVQAEKIAELGKKLKALEEKSENHYK
jgi:hypothetical protein